MQPAPSQPQIVRRLIDQLGNFNFNLGQALPFGSALPVAAPTQNRRRPASFLASRSVGDRRFHTLAGSLMR
jgi:hypothetical protein